MDDGVISLLERHLLRVQYLPRRLIHYIRQLNHPVETLYRKLLCHPTTEAGGTEVVNPWKKLTEDLE